jgi:hypothetical protein
MLGLLQCTPSHHDKTNAIDHPSPRPPTKIVGQGTSIDSTPPRRGHSLGASVTPWPLRTGARSLGRDDRFAGAATWQRLVGSGA